MFCPLDVVLTAIQLFGVRRRVDAALAIDYQGQPKRCLRYPLRHRTLHIARRNKKS